MDTNFILTQILGGIALILVCFSYFVKNKKYFLLIQVFANIFYAGAFLFQNLFVAGFNTIVSIVRTAIFYLYFKSDKNNIPIYVPLIFTGIYILNFVVFYTSMLDITALFTSIVFTFALYIKNMQTTRCVSLLPNIVLCVYNFVNKCYSSSVLDLIESVVIIVSIIYYHIKSKKVTESTSITKNENNRVGKLWKL